MSITRRFAPDPALFKYFIEQTRNTAGSIYGRGLYEAMRYWDGDDWDQDSPAQGDLRAFAEAWRATDMGGVALAERGRPERNANR